MAIPKIIKQNIIDALKYIDENGVPLINASTVYDLVAEDGKKYPPKYVIAVANHLANNTEISTEGFNAVEAKSFLENQGFNIEVKQQEKYTLTVTADNIESNNERFTMNDLGIGDDYKPLDVYFKKANGEIIKRNYFKGERRYSNQTMPRIACQVFEKQISNLSVEDKENFPVCKYNPKSEMICGIFNSIEEFKKHRNTIEYLTYDYDNGRQFVIYCWNIFSTLYFVQECLKRFGESGDQFVMTYRERNPKESEDEDNVATTQEELVQQFQGYRNSFSSLLIESKNIILRGAPGTGKSYLAKEIAADIISNGYTENYSELTDEQKEQVEFVQFHPSYDYSDFMEGLRPKLNSDGTMGFDLQDGIFKRFIARARKNYEDYRKPKETFEKEVSIQEAIEDFISHIEPDGKPFKTLKGSEFIITNVDKDYKFINISIPNNSIVNKLTLNLDDIRKMLESGQKFTKIKDITKFFGKTFALQDYSYYFTIYKAISDSKSNKLKANVKPVEIKKYIFIIDEINRGEISKIFGELFYSIDPGYRGKKGEILTQFSNMHLNPKEKFYIPDNVYIIGTMNDIDRSVDSFDFAMRRRFRFVELKANDDSQLEMLADLNDEALKDEAIKRMSSLNNEIVQIEDLNENYQIGASYFLKLKTLNFDQLWTDYLQPLLQEYIHGMYDEKGIMDRFAKAYGYQSPANGNLNEDTQNQG